ncbi:cation diffusion facilitator family transporter [Vibrio sp.]|nr:cation diffusion facilitator family transporter [Vibrio sp.]
MCQRVQANEKQVLSFSAIFATGFAIIGVILGVISGSLVILFDGLYSTLSLLLTLLSLGASRYIQSPSKRLFPQGKAAIEPVVIAIKGLVILIVVAFSLYEAILALFSGGRSVDPSIATLFGVINVVGCGYAWWYIVRKSQQFSSGLIEAESKQWQMDTLLSVAVMLGFMVAWAISVSPFAYLAPYADPAMMVLMSFYFIKVPLDMLSGAIRELLTMSPETSLVSQVEKKVASVAESSNQDIQLMGVVKIGNELRVNIDIHPTASNIDVSDVRKVQKQLTSSFNKMPFDLNLTMNIAL